MPIGCKNPSQLMIGRPAACCCVLQPLTLTWCVQENNFKAVLESIRDLMNEETVLPEWLHDIFLGYGDPAAAQYSKLPNTLRTLDFKVHITTCHQCSELPNTLCNTDLWYTS